MTVGLFVAWGGLRNLEHHASLAIRPAGRGRSKKALPARDQRSLRLTAVGTTGLRAKTIEHSFRRPVNLEDCPAIPPCPSQLRRPIEGISADKYSGCGRRASGRTTE